ncbi:SPOR domain-containing protein [Nitrosomonas sp.]|uniref:SPOR domain-containing protein n=1 Tax=Nitrosomonas sp. TaxID=42353 RepID=UPI0025ECE889|nr:SPOR domain-containing protein [Nitrosomonas sp.]MCC6917139.1 SPOR domain-containing protein [Nitrosomonas sp.]
MSRDYKSRNSANNRKNGGSLWLGLFIGYTLGLASAIGVWLYISQAPSPFLNGGKAAQTQSAEKAPVQQPSSSTPSSDRQEKKTGKNTNQADTNGPRFDFYKILPGIDEPPVEEAFDLSPLPPAATVTKKPPEKTADKPAEKTAEKISESRDRYYLQAGSFRNSSDAERTKAELALLGIIASVQPGRTEGNISTYRVRIGPFTRMEELDRVRASLQTNGIAASLVRASNGAQ